MIANERQYKITKSQARKFRAALARLDAGGSAAADIDARIARAQRESYVEQLRELELDISRFEALRAGGAAMAAIVDLSAIGGGLIEARIANGMSQRDLAARLGMKEQQIQRYERERYRSASLRRLSEIAGALSVTLRGTFEPAKSIPSRGRGRTRRTTATRIGVAGRTR